MLIDRRNLMSLLPAAIAGSALVSGFPEDSSAQSAAQSAPQPGVLPSAVYPFESLPARTMGTMVYRPILKGKLATGENIEVHESTLQPGGSPHPPHHHEHSEMWLIREGIVDITILGNVHRLGPGSLAFAHSNDEHGITNPGDKPATYFIVAVGPTAGS